MEKFIKMLDIPHDKALHILVGLIVFMIAHFISLQFAMIAVAVVAVGKEGYDYVNRDVHTPDAYDAVATMIGGVLGFLCNLR